MSEARAITNLIGNGVATVVVARWEGALDMMRMNRLLNGEAVDELQMAPTTQPKAEPAAVAEEPWIGRTSRSAFSPCAFRSNSYQSTRAGVRQSTPS